ncbi:MAG: hypothetical protein JXX28_05080 [Deltaproteobacteria bacterium]|nr:hypothetical protein [Deltaproteobacteria bacterium]
MMTVDGIRLAGVTVGGLESAVRVPDWRLCFDMGRGDMETVKVGRVLFTHAHLDHMAGAPWHCATRDLMGMAPPSYWVPAPLLGRFQAMMEAWRALSGSALPHEVHGVEPGDWVPLDGRGLRGARVFRTFHRAPSVGYALVERRTRLRPELVGLPGSALGARRLAGEEITESVEEVRLAYTGDTGPEVLEEPCVQRARVLLLELTFLDGRVSVEKAEERGHIHLEHLLGRGEYLLNPHVVAIHLSARYDRDEAERILDARLPSALRARLRLFR